MRFALFAVLGLVAACAGPQTPAPRAPSTENGRPSASAGEAPPASDPFALAGAVTEETFAEPPSAGPNLAAWTKTVEAVAIPKPAPTCAAWTHAKPAKAPACSDRPAALAALDGALAETDAKKRDLALSSLESCAGLPAGMVRALRADLAPTECADAIVDPMLRAPVANTPAPIMHTLVGLSLAARYERAVGKPPAFTGATTKERIKVYIEGPYKKWVNEQAKAIEDLSVYAKELASYGRALGALHAGMADLRFIERVREAPVPTEFQRDAELKDVYFGTLDAMLEPRKVRGRDATLVALNDYAAVGAIADPRVKKARSLLGQLYAGRRIDALDALFVPPAAAPAPSSVEERLAAALPTFYTGLLLEPAVLTSSPVLRVLSRVGVPQPARAALASDTGRSRLSPEDRSAYARARLDLGRLYWRKADFDQAASLAIHPKRTPEDTLVLALALDLRHAPDGAVAMMRAATPAELELRHVGALDALTKSEGPMAGPAAFDAALLLATAPPSGKEGPPHFQKVAERFQDAARRLTDPALAHQAEERAKEAASTAATK